MHPNKHMFLKRNISLLQVNSQGISLKVAVHTMLLKSNLTIIFVYHINEYAYQTDTQVSDKLNHRELDFNIEAFQYYNDYCYSLTPLVDIKAVIAFQDLPYFKTTSSGMLSFKQENQKESRSSWIQHTMSRCKQRTTVAFITHVMMNLAHRLVDIASALVVG
ncbi:hypothetical protein BD560DRAFT_491558 [Blakeslea trispora]|nr:hypothetical protein BD560DRAFT_491558 [Blakeslea trispora]